MALKIIREPKVYLIASTANVRLPMQQFLADEGLREQPDGLWWNSIHPETLIENAGRVCYMSYGKGRKTNEEFLRNLIDSGHHSVLEHANWSLLITGISRSLSHEFVRHRHFSYSQLSQRYVDSSDVAFILPDEIAANPDLEEHWRRAVWEALTQYKHIEEAIRRKYEGTDIPHTLRIKLARQAARSVLPNATETKMVVTGNARSWREFFEKRGSIHADVEIRRLAVRILQVLEKEAPTIFSDFSINAEGGIDVARKSNGEPASRV